MQDADLFAFLSTFRSLLKVFPKRMDEDDATDLGKAYFHALRRFSIPELQAGADVWMQRGKFFPKPSEWRESIPRARAHETAALFPVTPVEAAEFLDAERRGYEGEPCQCPRCVGAGVDHRLLRFVPETDADGNDARALIGERVIVRGRWIHGDELRRWYDARDRYMALKDTVLSSKQMRDGRKADMEPSPYAQI